jgi:hypothetical protein
MKLQEGRRAILWRQSTNTIRPATIFGVSAIGGVFNQKVIESMSRLNEPPVTAGNTQAGP